MKRSELLPGDLVFFRDSTGYVHHVGMSLGGDKFIHAPHTGDVVKISSLDEPYYKEQFTGGRRFDKAATAAPAAPAAPAVAAPAVAPAPVADPVAVASAQAAVARDAAEAARQRQRAVQGAQRPGGAQPRGGARAGERRQRSAAQRLGHVPPGDHARARRGGQGRRAVRARTAAGARGRRARRPGGPGGRARRRRRARGRRRDARRPGPDLSDVPAGYPGNDAGQKALAKWLAKHAEKAGLPPELPVMASLVESGVRNLDYGDADSVGFFQMRTSIWDQGEYAGYGKNPGLQAKWFIDHALAVKKQAIARGDGELRQGPERVGRVDRGRRAAGGAVPRPLPAAPRGGAPAAALSGARGARRPGLSPRRRRCG